MSVCVCVSHRWLFRSTFSPWVYSLSLSQPTLAASNTEEYLHDSSSYCSPRGRRLPPAWGFTSTSHSSGRVEPYSGCSGWVCRPFSGRGMLWFFQKALCIWSTSDTSGRPISKCIFRFSSHSSSLVKAGLKIKKADKDLSLKYDFIYLYSTQNTIKLSPFTQNSSYSSIFII